MQRTSQPQVLYIDPEATGHHVALYARALWSEFTKRGWKIIWLTSAHAKAHPATAELLAEFGTQVRIIEAGFPPAPLAGEQPFRTLLYQRRHCQALREALTQVVSDDSPDCVFHACLDQCDRFFGLKHWDFNGLPWTALHMTAALSTEQRASHHPGSPLKAALSRMLTRRTYRNASLRRIFVLNDGFTEFAKRKGWREANKFRAIPDLRLTTKRGERSEARTRQGFGKEEKVLLCFGMMTERKGVRLLLQALRDHPGHLNTCIVIAGEQSQAFHSDLNSELKAALPANLRVDIRRRFVDSNEQADLFAAADLVWAGYPGFMHPSGVVELAATQGVACIGGINTSIAAEISRRGCGVLCDLNQAQDIAQAVRRVWETPEGARTGTQAGVAPSGAAAIVIELEHLLASERGDCPPFPQ